MWVLTGDQQNGATESLLGDEVLSSRWSEGTEDQDAALELLLNQNASHDAAARNKDGVRPSATMTPVRWQRYQRQWRRVKHA